MAGNKAQQVPETQISSFLVQTLVQTKSLNDFFEWALPEISKAFGAARGVLVDYRENTGHFDVLYFAGYEDCARYRLQQELQTCDLKRGIDLREPYFSSSNPLRLFLPLYFTETLEATIVLESDRPIELTAERRYAALVVSRFIGLLMSSNRLSINKTGIVDFDDLQRARQIQLSYLPQANLATDRYEVYGYNQSSALVGGDYFDYFRLRDDSIQCILADASGHGLSAALIMSTFRALLHSEIQRRHEFNALFDVLNQSVHSGGSIVQYLTGVFLDFDEGEGQLRYINAGHFDPAVVHNDGSIERLSGGGPPLGMFKHSKYPSRTAKIAGGDLLVLFTDGLTDLRNQSDDFFGEQRILNIAAAHRERSLKDIANVLLEQGIAFSATPNPEDDLTLFMVRFR
jgi:serine phosphatase RsbU (regulator of sigma subunit)